MLLNNHPNPNGIQPYTNQSVGFGQASQSLIHSSKKDETYKKNGKKQQVKWSNGTSEYCIWMIRWQEKQQVWKEKKTKNDLS